MDNLDFLNFQADNLVAKIKHYLITLMGRVIEEATSEELYRAISFALREEIMMHWTATTHSYIKKDCRMLYYLSMEYLPGRFLSNNIINMTAMPLMQLVMQKIGRSLTGILENETDPSLGNGGLGRLASCFLDSFATQHYPAVAYGLRYQYGIFEQELWEGIQIERPDCWLLYENPWEIRLDASACPVKFNGHTNKHALIHPEDYQSMELKDYEEIRALPYDMPIVGYCNDSNFSVSTLRLWSTKESPRNFQLQRFNAGLLDEASENTTLTDVLYPNDNHEVGKRIRLKQEYLLVSASIQDIIKQYLSSHADFSSFADKVRIQINDTHPTLVIPELIWTLTRDYKISFDDAYEITKTCTSYTNHTIMKEGLEEWNETRLKTLLPCQYRIIQYLNQKFCNFVRARYPGDEEKIRRLSIIEGDQVRMANLAIIGSHHINGVAELHTEILKHYIFKDFFEIYPERFINVTNGVTQRRWLLNCNKELSEFITERIGNKWIEDFTEIQKLDAFTKDEESQNKFLEVKRKKKQELIEFLKYQNTWKDAKGNYISCSLPISEHSIFEVHIKRFHEYKRQLMNILQVIIDYFDIIDHPEKNRVPRTIIFAGKAAPGYIIAKQIVQLIYCVARKINENPFTNNLLRVILIENYNVSRAEQIIPAADLSVQIPTAGMEASGTGNMKLAINGALTIGTNDGANLEMHRAIGDIYWPFSFGLMSHEIEQIHLKHSYKPYQFIENYPNIKRALESLKNKTFANNDEEHQVFTYLYYHLLEGTDDRADKYFVLRDLPSYIYTQNKVQELFMQPNKWAMFALKNISGMGKFSVDCAVKKYANEIWHIRPCQIDQEIMSRVTKEYSAHDKCRILTDKKNSP
jgi:starch phosphorylase